jgi:hypothetical protein
VSLGSRSPTFRWIVAQEEFLVDPLTIGNEGATLLRNIIVYPYISTYDVRCFLGQVLSSVLYVVVATYPRRGLPTRSVERMGDIQELCHLSVFVSLTLASTRSCFTLDLSELGSPQKTATRALTWNERWHKQLLRLLALSVANGTATVRIFLIDCY